MTPSEIFNAPGPRYFSIASGRPFLTDLARGLTASLTAAGLDVSDAHIYLPTRRAARALSEAFLEAAGTNAALTPHIRALGDIDEDEFVLDDLGGTLDDELSLPPAISSANRRLILARLIAERDRVFFDGQHRWAGAISAADELGKLLDSLYTEEIDASDLDRIVPDGLAEHWQGSLEFLKIVTELWPNYLAEQSLFDPAARRIALIDKQTRRWEEVPPSRPIVIAGTTGSTPAVGRMMSTVAALPFGCVVLPGLDLRSPDHVWDAVDEPHPQSGLKSLIESLKVERGAIYSWPTADGNKSDPRADLVTMALRPADASDDWRQWAEEVKSNKDAISKALEGFSLVEARDEEREASIVASRLREVVSVPAQTAMLVTPDRDLARRVAIKMRRWGVVVDDSAGAPFANTPCGIFLRLTAAWLSDVSDPVHLMALLDHSRFGGGVSGKDRARAIGRVDRALRGLKPQGGFAGLRKRLELNSPLEGEFATFFETLERAAKLWPNPDASFTDRFEAHLAASEVLCGSDEEAGAERLWRGDDGDEGAALLATMRDSLGLITHDQSSEYVDIFTRLIAGGAVRRREPAHPRLSILGPLEARLQTADVIILAGLNEGVWPRDAAIDPFLSRPMRKELGLPSPERRIGLAAHDFAQLSASPEVLLTRSTRAGGKPTKPSRWIVRLKNILKGAQVLETVDVSQRSEAIAGLLDKPKDIKHIHAPKPLPPAEARPTEFAVTAIEKLLRDPYAIYARRILGLKKLDALSEDFSARHVGNLFHKIMEEYAHGPLPDVADREARLRALFDAHAPEYGYEARHDAFWRERVGDALVWLASWDTERRALGTPAVIEGKGEYSFDLNGTRYTLNARADRIDLLSTGGAFVIDYKTGDPPSLKMQQKFSPQLPLTGFIVEKGGFDELGAAPVDGFEYLKVVGRKAKERDAGLSGDDAAKLIAETRDGLVALLLHFADPENAYLSQPRPQYTDSFGDYDHLARRRERSAQGDGGGDE
ncbi:double-strand break repair protein AddB [Hyphococcus lacteus]|uniref:Double-strand break repair protein AddB n=1 Tax=Hyphococcus lacteus TaxID=3143536 RepID=A0ABV3Z5J0_9PROT